MSYWVPCVYFINWYRYINNYRHSPELSYFQHFSINFKMDIGKKD